VEFNAPKIAICVKMVWRMICNCWFGAALAGTCGLLWTICCCVYFLDS